MIAGIDPGRWKTGVAFAESERLLFSAIVPSDKSSVLSAAFKSGDWKLLEEWGKEGSIENILGRTADKVYIGTGTSYKDFQSELPVSCESADEYGTTLEARNIYWKLHPPRGLLRLIPLSLRTPPRPIDDLAAYAIVLRAGDLDRSDSNAAAG
ncbi:MAG: hypothetical protein K6E42_05490 [Synergistes sp.]|nr:hypothetical protein [Synergistes sp.]